MALKRLNVGFENQTELLQLNLHGCSLNYLSNYTPVTARPDLILANGELKKQVPMWTVAEKDNAENWKHGDFDYVLNSLGFRDIEINQNSHLELAAFGCSYTFGVGLPSDKLWHKLLSKKHNLNSYNFGISGSSIKATCDVFSIISRHMKIDRAVFLMPSYGRQLCAINKINNQSIKLCNLLMQQEKDLEDYNIQTKSYFKYTPEPELIRRMKDDIYNLDYLSKLKDIKTFISSWDRPTYQMMKLMKFEHITLLPEWTSPEDIETNLDLARDRSHPGINHHKYWADQIEGVVCQ